MSELQNAQINTNEDFQNIQTKEIYQQKHQQAQKYAQESHGQNIENAMSLQHCNNSHEKKQQEGNDSSKMLQRVKSTQQLESQFNHNSKILENLNSNIDDLFKKISQLTQEVQIDLKHKNSLQFEEPNDLDKQKQNYFQTVHEYELGTKQKDLLTNPSQNNLENQLDDLDIGLSMKDFQTGKTLGYGKFGQVMQCRHLKTGTFYALKKIFKSTISQYKMEDQTIIQIEALKRLNHPNIVKAYKSFTDPFHVFIIFEYVEGTQLIKKFKSSEKQVSDIIYQVLSAIKHMHQHKVVHRDLKPQNIMITQGNLIKITDFGWASLDSQQLDIMCGTLDYLSPQMAENSVYTKAIDLWSVGVLTYELIFGIAPFKGQNRTQTIQIIKKIEIKYPEQIPISQECKQFIEGLLKPSSSRKDLDWALQHQFIRQSKWMEQNKQLNMEEQIKQIL